MTANIERGAIMDDSGHCVSYEDAVATLAVVKLEVVGEARRIDPEGADHALLEKTTLMLDAMETYACVLFDVDRDRLKDDLGQVDPSIVQRYRQDRVMMAAEESMRG